MQIAANTARMALRRRRLVRFVPFAALRKEEQEEHDGELVGERPTPVQPAGYGMTSAVQDPADLLAECDAVQRAMAQLPETLRLCLVLSIIGGTPPAQNSPALRLREAAGGHGLLRVRTPFPA